MKTQEHGSTQDLNKLKQNKINLGAWTDISLEFSDFHQGYGIYFFDFTWYLQYNNDRILNSRSLNKNEDPQMKKINPKSENGHYLIKEKRRDHGIIRRGHEIVMSGHGMITHGHKNVNEWP